MTGAEEGLAVLERASCGDTIPLPSPRASGAMSVEEAMRRRRSVREFRPDPLSLAEIAQLLWSAQGVTASGGRRTAPSAGARFPLELYLVCEQGLFLYLPSGHELRKVAAGDLRAALSAAAFGQRFVAEAPVSLVFAAVYERTTSRYGDRGVRYVHMDVGHAGQNVQLEAEALGLGSCSVGAFDDGAVAGALNLPQEHEPVYIIPVGRPA